MGINHVALEVGDIDEALGFYSGFLNFEIHDTMIHKPLFISGINLLISPSIGIESLMKKDILELLLMMKNQRDDLWKKWALSF